ncbi:MAG: hypothetical protein AAF682_09030 [Planctomycetota bacterium]
MKFKQPERDKIPMTPGVSKGEKLKLILMSIALVVVGVSLWYSVQAADGYRSEEMGDLPAAESEAPQEVAFRPDVDKAALDALVADAEGADRVMLELDAVTETLRSARQMTAYSYEVVEAPELNAARGAEIVADPSAFRGEPFFARGWIDSLEERRQGPGSETQYLGRLQLEDDSYAYFLTVKKPEGSVLGEFARVDGLFLKMFSDESPEERGKWLDGPLLVGRELRRSYADFGAVTEVDERLMIDIVDDDVSGISGLPFQPLWHLMAYARDVQPDSVDWEAAPLLDKAMLEEVRSDGGAFRCEPFRIPVSRLQSITIKQAKENPARIERYTEGWIGNALWKNVIHYVGPFEYDQAELSQLVTARGFFLKNYAYEPSVGGVNVAPVFVLTDIERFHADEDPMFSYMGYVIAASAVGLLIFLSFLLTRDKRSSRELQSRLTQRRRARREATA